MIMTMRFMEEVIEKERRAFLNEKQTPEKKYKLCALDFNGLLVTRCFAEGKKEYALESAQRYWSKPNFLYVELFCVKDGEIFVCYHGARIM
ncbi:MAG: hypothetical protein J6X11_09740 [Treponema sp.]|nr:hypothetical protein [Treponema sp.]